MNDNKKYEERIIAFIDILGFRAMINDTVKEDIVNQEKLNVLVKVLELIKNEFRKVNDNAELPYSFRINFFSDSIVLSLKKYNTIGLLSIFEILKKIQIKLVEYEILLRGGIVVGKLIHEENLILGPAMNEAYDLESKSALYPRITIDPDVMEMAATDNELSEGLIPIKEFDYQKTFEVDLDYTYYINYFSDITEHLEDGDVIKYYRNLRQVIRKGVNRKDIGVRMKYLWMLNKFNTNKPSNIKAMAYKEIDELNEQIKNKFR